MNNLLFVLLFCPTFLIGNKPLPAWFAQSFNDQQLQEKYLIIKAITPGFLEADFNGDKRNDLAVQVIDKKNKKRGILIIHAGQKSFFVFGAGKKFKKEDFDNTNWMDGWQIDNKHIAYETQFNSDGDIAGSKKVKINYPGISIYSLQDGEPLAGLLLYWDGTKYNTIHQGE
jgi:hypothetical protein